MLMSAKDFQPAGLNEHLLIQECRTAMAYINTRNNVDGSQKEAEENYMEARQNLDKWYQHKAGLKSY